MQGLSMAYVQTIISWAGKENQARSIQTRSGPKNSKIKTPTAEISSPFYKPYISTSTSVYFMSLPINPTLPLLPSPVFFLLWQVKILILLLLLLLILMLVQMLLFHLLWQRTFPINVTCIILFHCTVISKSSKTLRAAEAPEQITWSHVSTARAQSTNQLGFLPSWVISLTDLYVPIPAKYHNT